MPSHIQSTITGHVQHFLQLNVYSFGYHFFLCLLSTCDSRAPCLGTQCLLCWCSFLLRNLRPCSLCPAHVPRSCTHAAITARPCSQRSHMPPSAQQLRDTAPEHSRNAATPRISSRHSMNTTNERLTAQYERTNEHRRISTTVQQRATLATLRDNMQRNRNAIT